MPLSGDQNVQEGGATGLMAISRSCVCSVVWCPGVMRMVLGGAALPTHNRTCPWTKARLIYAFLLPCVVCKAYGSGLALGRGRVESMLATGRQKCIKTPRGYA